MKSEQPTSVHYDNILILAGGESSRFWPLSSKAEFQFMGRAVLEHQMERLAGFTDKLIIVGRSPDVASLVRRVGNKNAVYVEQVGKGQSSAIMSAKDQLSGSTLIVNANDMFELGLIEAMYAKRDADVVLSAVEVSEYVPGGYLVLDGNRVKGIMEKPGPNAMPSPYWRFVTDYFKDIQTFLALLATTESAHDDVYEVALTHFMMGLAKAEFVQYQNDWATLKYPWHVLDMQRYLLTHVRPHTGKGVQIHPTATIIGDVYFDDGAMVHEYSKIVGPAYIGKDVIIGNYALVLQSIVENKSVIGGYSEITRSYIGPDTWTHRAYIGDSVINGPANFGAGSVTANFRFDKQTVRVMVKGEKVDTGKQKLGLIAGAGVHLGVNSSTMPGVTMEAGSHLQPGTVAYTDVHADTKK